MTAVTLRSATAADSESCFQLHKAAMGPYVEAVWGWDEDVQRGFHARKFEPGRWQVICVGSAHAGNLIVDYGPDEVYLARIEIHPDYQGRGIGGYLIDQLIDDAHQRGQHLALDVMTANHRAHAFYCRHGFQEAEQQPDWPLKIRMRCCPAARG